MRPRSITSALAGTRLHHTGGPVPDKRHLELAGYLGDYDIAGNWVNHQFQLDAFGKALLLFAATAHHDRLDRVGRRPKPPLPPSAARWTEPDAGIWQINNRPWTHGRLTAAGQRAIAAAHLAAAQGTDWLALADHIVADTAAHSLHRDGHWQRSPDEPPTTLRYCCRMARCRR